MIKHINEKINDKNENMSMVIYKAIFPNGKTYIGQTTRAVKERIQQHKKDSKFKTFVFYRAIRKYGWDSLKWKLQISVILQKS